MSSNSNSIRPRRSRSRKRKASSSSLQVELEHAIQVPGGVHRTLDLVRGASREDIDALPDDYSPLPGVIMLSGSTYTRRRGSRIPANLMPSILRLIQLCHQRGISIDGGSIHGEHFQRPLVLAAYYGFKSLVLQLLDLGATPDLADGEGRTAWHSALQNPAGQCHVLRDCDREIAQLLVQRGLVTSSLRKWRSATKGSVIYVNEDCASGSPLLNALRNKNPAVVELLVQNGAVITDRDYLALARKRSGVAQLKKAASESIDDTNIQQTSKSNETDWSFPPTWKVGTGLINYCGLPRDIFMDHIIPYLSRDWFYTPTQIEGPLPALLGARLGQDQYNMGSRSIRWKHEYRR